MSNTIKWAEPGVSRTLIIPASATTANANGAFSDQSAAVQNSVGLYQYCDLELYVKAQGSNRSAGGYVAVFIAYSLNGFTNGEDASLAALTHQVLCRWQLDAATTARRVIAPNLPVAPFDFKLQLYNLTGQAFATDTDDGTGTVLYYALHNEQVT